MCCCFCFRTPGPLQGCCLGSGCPERAGGLVPGFWVCTCSFHACVFRVCVLPGSPHRRPAVLGGWKPGIVVAWELVGRAASPSMFAVAVVSLCSGCIVPVSACGWWASASWPCPRCRLPFLGSRVSPARCIKDCSSDSSVLGLGFFCGGPRWGVHASDEPRQSCPPRRQPCRGSPPVLVWEGVLEDGQEREGFVISSGGLPPIGQCTRCVGCGEGWPVRKRSRTRPVGQVRACT